MIDPTRLQQLIHEELPSLVQIRRGLHQNPGLSYDEVYASAVVKEELGRAAIPFRDGLARGPRSAAGTGVVGYLPGIAPEAIGLRADMDALPIQEQSGCAYGSTVPGVMHACGHDGHTTILIGAARVLARLSQEALLPQPVRFIFQPAEEGGAGAARMIADGCLDEMGLAPRVSHMFGLHGWPDAPLGAAFTRIGPATAATASFSITVRGRGGHDAFPHYNQDPIVAASAIVGAVQSIVSRNIDPTLAGVVSITQFISGHGAYNVIPSDAAMRGTLRALDAAVMELLKRRLGEVVSHTAGVYQCVGEVTFEIEGMAEYPVTMNSAEAVGMLKAAMPALHTEFPVVMGAEDFSFYSQKVPSAFFIIGLRPGQERIPGLHTPGFNFNDDAIATGVEAFCRVALHTQGDGMAGGE